MNGLINTQDGKIVKKSNFNMSNFKCLKFPGVSFILKSFKNAHKEY